MPTPTKGPRLGGGPAHERLLLANLAAALFTHKRITTTLTKAKRLRPFAERLVTFAKRGDLHARRRVLSVITDKGVVHELFAIIAPQVEFRPGGYTRITKIGNRKGDNAPMAVIELVLDEVEAQPRATSRARRGASADVVSEDVAEVEDMDEGDEVEDEDEDEDDGEYVDVILPDGLEDAAEESAAADDADGSEVDADNAATDEDAADADDAEAEAKATDEKAAEK